MYACCPGPHFTCLIGWFHLVIFLNLHFDWQAMTQVPWFHESLDILCIMLLYYGGLAAMLAEPAILFCCGRLGLFWRLISRLKLGWSSPNFALYVRWWPTFIKFSQNLGAALQRFWWPKNIKILMRFQTTSRLDLLIVNICWYQTKNGSANCSQSRVCRLNLMHLVYTLQTVNCDQPNEQPSCWALLHIIDFLLLKLLLIYGRVVCSLLHINRVHGLCPSHLSVFVWMTIWSRNLVEILYTKNAKCWERML